MKLFAKEVKHPKSFVSYFMCYTKLNNIREQVLLTKEDRVPNRWPSPIKKDKVKHNQSEFHQFHKEVGYDTNDYFDLKEDIEDLIRRGRLWELIWQGPPL